MPFEPEALSDGSAEPHLGGHGAKGWSAVAVRPLAERPAAAEADIDPECAQCINIRSCGAAAPS